MKQSFQLEFAGRTLTVETGALAGQANGAAVVRYGETVLLATAVMGGERSGIDFFPLTVDYDEKLYAAGRIKGSRWVKREGRPTDEAVLSGRLVDRAIRPRFDHRLRRDVQVVITVLSFDNENDPDILSLIGASLALSISNIPWDGPIAAVRIGRNGEDASARRGGADDRREDWVINPTYELREKSVIDIVFAGTKERINMIEAGAREAPEALILQAAELAHEHIRELIVFQETVAAALAPVKQSFPRTAPPASLEKDFQELAADELEKTLFQPDLGHRWAEEVGRLKKSFAEALTGRYNDAAVVGQGLEVFEQKLDELIHHAVIDKGRRPDARKTDELRPLGCLVGLLPRTHGSGLFQRGETQALSAVTLGSPGLEQHLEGMEIIGTKRFMHHYNFPPFSTGETGRLQGPGRREIGHGALVERALGGVIPPKETFPYTIRVVSEVLSSNGSTSMASLSASTLALMDAGVPIAKPVAGIAMGLMTDPSGEYRVLTDIQGPEDHHGDMDLKVAGTDAGITALQMDVKIDGITLEMLRDALEQAKKARHEILAAIAACLPKPRETLSRWAPRIFTIQINPERIRDVIGPGGKTIRAITAETGVEIDVEDSGLVFVTAPREDAAQKALEWIQNLTREVKVGEVFNGKVTRIMDFGAIVEILPGQDGLVHISELAPHRVERVEEIVRTGDTIPVKVIAVHPDGKISLSVKAMHEPEGSRETQSAPRESRRPLRSPRTDRAPRREPPSKDSY